MEHCVNGQHVATIFEIHNKNIKVKISLIWEDDEITEIDKIIM